MTPAHGGSLEAARTRRGEPWCLRPRMVVTRTTALGRRPLWRHLMFMNWTGWTVQKDAKVCACVCMCVCVNVQVFRYG